VGAAGGKGHVFVHGQQVGEATLAQVSVGFQAAGPAYTEIIFLADTRSPDEFESGNFLFGADYKVVAITAVWVSWIFSPRCSTYNTKPCDTHRIPPGKRSAT
jgi:hypothetical protein